MGKIIKTCLIIIAIQLVLLCVLVRPSYVIKVMAQEGVKIEDTLGTHTLNDIDRYSSMAYNEIFIKTHLYATIWHLFIPTKSEDAKSPKIKFFKGLELWLQDRINLMFTLFFLLFQRLTLMFMWVPTASWILLGSIAAGVLRRRIKQSNFAFASPTLHRAAIRIILIVVVLSPFILSTPIAVSPYFYPVGFIILAFMIQETIANVAKRI